MKGENGMSFNDNKQQTYYAITEQGDLGLGLEVLNEQDQKTMLNTEKKEDKENK